MSTHLGTKGRLFAAPSGIVLSFGGTVTAPVVLPTPDAPVITVEDDAAQTLTFSLAAGLSYDQVRYEVAGAGPYTPSSFTIQLSPTVSYLPGAVVLYVVGIEGVRNESRRSSNLTTLAAYVPPANTTPPAPVLSGDDMADTLTISSPYALAELEMRTTDNQTIRAVPAMSLAQGDVDRAAGYTQVRVKASTGRNVSPWADSPAFTKKPSGTLPPPAGWTGAVAPALIEQSSPFVVATGEWYTEENPAYSGGNGFYCTVSNSPVRLRFWLPSPGRLSLIHLRANSLKVVQFTLNGVTYEIDQYAQTLEQAALRFTSPILPAGAHELVYIRKETGTTGPVVYDAVQLTLE
ncbi:hypothetical protein [Hymenobacter glacieicola]|uniref:Uncharacterized protein n=1 Tax=Hymenobacter glacieicola TaxID=1562124 RepID=A0ABQ1WL97_9BACT|nr:hypothetical protein [Hymenobacter glacieicola]GGG33473.1 hypothetical protein GCM10011378_07430 [Hymenobacter glacieicola]